MKIGDVKGRVDWLDLPYDVLGEIFVRCLPDNPLKRKQPDVAQAPMLLCQICSSWRYAALSTPRIWAHLYYVSVTKTPLGVFDAKDLDFLGWWHNKLGAVAPSLRLTSTGYFKLVDQDFDSTDFILELILSARYLNLDRHYCTALAALPGFKGLIYPNLDTLILSNAHDSLPPTHHRDTQNAIPISSNTYIRRLMIERMQLTLEDIRKPSIAWSHITHFYAEMEITLPGWFSLLRECVNLISGIFYLTIGGNVVNTKPPIRTLPQLRQLVLGGRIEIFLPNLSLPNLTSLRLCNSIIDVDDLHRILSSTPALKELQLSASRVSLLEGAFISGDISPLSIPLRNTVPELKSIHFGGHVEALHNIYMRVDIVLEALLGPWLSLEGPGNTIIRIEFSSERSPRDRKALETLIGDVKRAAPAGVQLVVRGREEPKLWDSWSNKQTAFADNIDHMLFREVL